MSTINNGIKQNKLKDRGIPSLDPTLYENIFKVNVINKDAESSYYFYNTLNSINIPADINGDAYEELPLRHDTPWTTLSYRLYGTIDLWWILVLVNKPDYIFMAKGGEDYKFIKPQYVSRIISKINSVG